MSAVSEMRTRATSGTRGLYLGVDVPLLLVAFTLIVFGLLMVYSASSDFSLLIYDSSTYMFNRQLRTLIVGLVSAAICAFLDYHYWRKLAVPGIVVVIIGLLAVLIVGEGRFGSLRGLQAGSYMPAEAAKLVTIVYLSVWLYSKRNFLKDIRLGLFPLAIIIGIMTGLIIIQPDLSAAATMILLGGILFFLAGGDLLQIAGVLAVVMLFGWMVVEVHPTGSARVNAYRAGFSDPLSASYHVQRSLEAFASGGVSGVGIGQGVAKHTGLPVPPTDSIFAVIGEETGLIGTTLVVVLFCLLVWRGLVIARRAPDMLGSLMAAGLTLWLALEAFINMGGMVNLLPFAGNGLPFVSYGGSSLVVSLAAIGILINISRVSKQQADEKERSLDAAVSVRRSERRRRVSRAGHRASTR